MNVQPIKGRKVWQGAKYSIERTGLTAVVEFEKILLGSTAQFYLQVQNLFKCKIVIRPLGLLLIVALLHK